MFVSMRSICSACTYQANVSLRASRASERRQIRVCVNERGTEGLGREQGKARAKEKEGRERNGESDQNTP